MQPKLRLSACRRIPGIGSDSNDAFGTSTWVTGQGAHSLACSAVVGLSHLGTCVPDSHADRPRRRSNGNRNRVLKRRK
jgi:hypothetical protein